MKKVILAVIFLGFGSSPAIACMDKEKPVAATVIDDSEAATPEAAVTAKASLPRMPASDGTCVVGEKYNATDSTCVSAGQ